MQKIVWLLVFGCILLISNVHCSIHLSENTYCLFGNSRLAHAKRLAENANWERAAKIWRSLVDHKNEAVAGKAAFNLALTCALMEEKQLAIAWATIAVQDYGNKRAKTCLQKFRKSHSNELRILVLR